MARTPARKWTDRERQTLREMYATHSRSEIAAVLGRTPAQVRSKCYVLRLNTKVRPWRDEEVSLLRQWYTWHSGIRIDLGPLVRQLKRSRFAICLKAEELGLTNSRRGKANPHPRRKFSTVAERKAAQSQSMREWHQTHPHPRGALGLKHSPETRQKISKMSRAFIERETPEQKSKRYSKMRQTWKNKVSNGYRRKQTNPYSTARRGKRADLDNVFFRSRWEANYARYLNFLKAQGNIDSWQYEPMTFVFHGVTRGALTYTPDFKVIEANGVYVWHEVKGWMKSIDRTRLKRMAKYYPAETVQIIGPEEYREIERKLASLIDNWERR